jgi:hypothetical protein
VQNGAKGAGGARRAKRTKGCKGVGLICDGTNRNGEFDRSVRFGEARSVLNELLDSSAINEVTETLFERSLFRRSGELRHAAMKTLANIVSVLLAHHIEREIALSVGQMVLQKIQ